MFYGFNFFFCSLKYKVQYWHLLDEKRINSLKKSINSLALLTTISMGLKLMSLNTRGLNSIFKRKALWNDILKFENDIVCI